MSKKLLGDLNLSSEENIGQALSQREIIIFFNACKVRCGVSLTSQKLKKIGRSYPRKKKLRKVYAMADINIEKLIGMKKKERKKLYSLDKQTRELFLPHLVYVELFKKNSRLELENNKSTKT